MIPILYESTETSFTSNGIGRLADCVSCLVTEERNGIFEVEFQYPVTGKLYSEITEGRIISVTHDDTKTRQPFVIYRRSAPIDGLVTFNAHHISYALAHCILQPFTASSISEAFSLMAGKSITPCAFTFWTDKVTSASFKVSVPISIKEILGGVEGSILDVFGGGEYQWDKYTVKLYQNRGTDSGVTIRYGKNLTDLTQERDTSGMYNSVIPYWTNGETVVTLGTSVVSMSGVSNVVAVPLDLSGDFDEAPTTTQLRNAAQTKLNNSDAWTPDENITIDFVALWQTDEYKDVAILQRVKLCDTITVIHPELNISAQAKVIKTVYNTLLDKYDQIEVGQPKTNFSDTVAKAVESAVLQAVPSVGMMQAAIDHATELITGGLGGYVVMSFNASGEPEEILIMDTDDVQTAVNVIRINKNGIGFSTSGYNGPFTTAWTIDGHFNADFITAGHISANLINAGTMSADRILGGTMKLGGSGNGNGKLEIYDANGNLIGTLDNTGANLTGEIMMKASNFFATVGSSYAYVFLSTFSGFSWANPYALNLYKKDSNNKTTSLCVFLENSAGFQESILTNKGAYYRPVTLSSDSDLDSSSAVNVSKRMLEVFDSDGYGIRYWKDPDFDFRLNLRNYNVRLMSDDKTAYIDLEGRDGYEQFTIIAGKNGLRFGVGVVQVTFNGSTWLNLTTSSAKKYKKNINPISKALDYHKLLDLPVVEFEYRKSASVQYIDLQGQKIPGFLAEDVAEIYPAASIHNPETGDLESWDERRILPGMLALIQEQKKQIDDLTARIEKLEAKI